MESYARTAERRGQVSLRELASLASAGSLGTELAMTGQTGSLSRKGRLETHPVPTLQTGTQRTLENDACYIKPLSRCL